MPTPSRNPPPDLPPSHSSTCPDELRSSSASWRNDHDDLDADANIETDHPSPLPEAVIAPPSNLLRATVVDSRSSTLSPGSSPINGHDQSPTTDSDGSHSSFKPMDVDDDASSRERTGDIDAPSTQRSSRAFSSTSPTSIEGDKVEDGVILTPKKTGRYSPSTGYGFSTIRVRAHHNISK